MDYSIVNDAIPTTEQSVRVKKFSLITFLDRILIGSLYATVLLIPLWFMPFTLDVLELNKQTLLVVLSMVALLAWVGKAIVQKSMSISRSWVHIVVALFVVGYLVASLLSQDRYLSLVGNFGQMQWAFATIAAFGVLYFVMVNSIKSLSRIYNFLLAYLGSSALVGLIGFLQMVGVYPFRFIFPDSANVAFNTVGSLNALAMYMAIPVVLALSLLVLGCQDERCALGSKGKGSTAAAVLVWATLVIGLVDAVLVDFWAVWASILVGTVCVLAVAFARKQIHGKPVALIVPGLVFLVSVALLIWQTPIKLALPGEVSPSLSHSWQIAKQTLQDHPLFGSGPGTWIYDYSKYRAISVNTSQFWTVRFDHGISTFMGLIATAGIIGTALWLILLLSALLKSAHHLMREQDQVTWQAYLTVFSGWITAAFAGFVYNYNVSHHFAFWFLLALLGSLVATGSYKWDAQRKPMAVTILSVVFIVLAACAFATLWLSGQRLVADAEYSKAILNFRAGGDITKSIDSLNSAVALNRLNDSYYRNLSQGYLIRASQVLQSQDPNKSSLVKQLVNASLDTAKRATDVSPANVDNWANTAIIYQAIASFWPGADEVAIKYYQEALMREPNNPVYYDEIGKIYILRADAYRTLLSSKDDKVRTDAENNARAELDKANEALNQAVQLKPDFALAHYNLAILYQRQGRLQEAITKMEQVLTVNNQDVGVGFQLAMLYYQNGDKDKAQSVLEQILKLDPGYSNANWYLSSLYEEAGRYDDALAQVQILEKAYPDNQMIAQRVAQLTQERDSKSKPKTQPIPQPINETVSGPGALNGVKGQ